MSKIDNQELRHKKHPFAEPNGGVCENCMNWRTRDCYRGLPLWSDINECFVHKKPFINGAEVEPVTIYWHDGEEWHWFYILEFKGEWVKLMGRDSPGGVTHCGNVFWVHRNDIKEMLCE